MCEFSPFQELGLKTDVCRRRPLVVLEKIAATFGTFSLIYTITEHYIMPYTPKPGENIIISFFNLALPMMVNYLL
jgi:sterol O-acyltransferase